MKVVKDLMNLIQLMHSYNEVIIFPIGGEGQQLLDFLRYADFLNRVCCIAATEVPDGTTQKFIHDLPVIPIKNLVHFRETALLIVAVSEQFHAKINALFTRLGFSTFVFVNNDILRHVRSLIQEMYSNNKVILWYLDNLNRKITKLDYSLAEQNSISDLNKKAFSEYQNAFRDKEVVVVGTGPTLSYYKPIPNAVHIGLNYAWKREDIPLDFIFTGYAKLNTPARHVEDGFSKVREKIFIFQSHCGLNYYLNTCPEDWSLKSDKVARYHINEIDFGQFIHQDICCHPVVDFGSVALSAMHFALFAYPKKLYFVGCDTSPTGHFYAESKKLDKLFRSEMDFATKFMKVGYARMKMFAKHYYPDTEIISINPVGLRGLFKDVYTDEYKAALAEQEKLKE